MRTLPQKQDELLKQLNEVESLEKKGVSPERSNTNIFLIFLILGVALLLIVLDSVGNLNFNINNTFVLISAGVFAAVLTLAYYNQFIGLLLASLTAIGLNFYLNFILKIDLGISTLTLIDSLTVFIVANQFKKSGYFLTFALIAIKNIYMFTDQDNLVLMEDLVASLINIGLIGILPVLITAIASVSRIAKAKEISSQLLALQNEDLLNSWLNKYQSNNKQNQLDSNSLPNTMNSSKKLNTKDRIDTTLQDNKSNNENDSPESIYTQVYK